MPNANRTAETATARGEKSLDLGCGRDKLPGSIGIDVNPRSDADVIHDLDVFPWPFDDNTFDYVRANDVLEHVANFEGCVRELHRVCKPGARIDVRMPFMGSNNFATDPTHRRAGTHRTFEYFEPEKPFGQFRYSEARLEVRSFHYDRGYIGKFGGIFRRLDKVIIPFLERNAHEYEAYFTGFWPMQNISYELIVVKDA
jgi:SAM-dependent methyltransferase